MMRSALFRAARAASASSRTAWSMPSSAAGRAGTASWGLSVAMASAASGVQFGANAVSCASMSTQAKKTKTSPGGAEVIDGKAIAADVVDEVRQYVEANQAAVGRVPGLAVVLVGAREDSKLYVGMKEKAAKKCHYKSVKVEMSADVSQEELLRKVQELNADESMDGILVQLPLPDHINQKIILEAIDKEKDVDGFHPYNLGTMARNGEVLRQDRKAFDPAQTRNTACTPLGCIELLERSNVDLNGANAVVVGRSNIVGLPVALMLMHKNATVTVCHSRTKDLAAVCREADVIVAAIGRAEMVKKDWVKPGAVVIDVGINSVEDPSRKTGRRTCGDVDYAGCSEVASKITPVPGGVGPMTVAILMRNALENWKAKARKAGKL